MLASGVRPTESTGAAATIDTPHEQRRVESLPAYSCAQVPFGPVALRHTLSAHGVASIYHGMSVLASPGPRAYDLVIRSRRLRAPMPDRAPDTWAIP